MISTSLLVSIIMWIGVAVALHIWECRRWLSRRPEASPQAFLLKFVLLCDLPLIATVVFLAAVEKRPMTEFCLMLVYALVVYNGFLYSYFHVFNMSETGRRVKMMVLIHRHGSLKAAELETGYTAQQMVRARLKRLLQMRQISATSDARYRLDHSPLLMAAYFILFVRKVLKLDRD